MVAERTNEYKTPDLSVFGLDQPIPDYYDVIFFNIPRNGSESSDRYLFLKQREEPDEQATFGELMDEVYRHTGGALLTGHYSISAVRIMPPNSSSGIYRFKIVAPRERGDYHSRVNITQLLVDHGLSE